MATNNRNANASCQEYWHSPSDSDAVLPIHKYSFIGWKRKREEWELRRALKLHKSAHYIHLVRFMCWDQWGACVASGGAFMHSFICVKILIIHCIHTAFASWV